MARFTSTPPAYRILAATQTQASRAWEIWNSDKSTHGITWDRMTWWMGIGHTEKHRHTMRQERENCPALRGKCCLANCDWQLSFLPTRATSGIDFFYVHDYTRALHPWPTMDTFEFLRSFLAFPLAILSECIISYFVNLRETWERSGSFGFRVSASSLATW